MNRIFHIAFSALLIPVMAWILVACDNATDKTSTRNPEKTDSAVNADLEKASWAELLEQAKGSTVTFYGWGGDEKRNAWLNTTVADYLKENYGITLKQVGMDIEDILSKLSGEKQAGSKTGTIDMIWINGENFYSAKQNGLLYGPFTHRLPNMEACIDLEDRETNYDFCMPIDGYEAPYARGQMILINDSAVTPEMPDSAQAFMEFCKKYPGRVTYPALPDFTGSAFVRNLIYEICGWEQFQSMEPDYKTVKAAVEPAMAYLRELNPYLWNRGKTFPESSTTVDRMFGDGELVLSMRYNPFIIVTGIEEGLFSKTTRTGLFEKGTIGNTNYIAIAYNSPNKAGAMVAINAMMSAEMQFTQYREIRELPVVDYDKLNAEEKKRFASVDMGPGVLSLEELAAHRLPECGPILCPSLKRSGLKKLLENKKAEVGASLPPLQHSLIVHIRLTLFSSPINEGVRGKSFPPAGYGAEPRKKKTLYCKKDHAKKSGSLSASVALCLCHSDGSAFSGDRSVPESGLYSCLWPA